MTKLADVSKNDLIIAVMGYSGCGKTNFIAKASGQGAEFVNKSLIPQSPGLRTFITTDPTTRRRVVLLDTPGFDDAAVSDAQTLSLIAEWLIELKKRRARIGGVLYLHAINKNRIPSPARENIETFVQLCGAEAMPNVILVTTMWDDVDPSTGENRERELEEEFWCGMIRDGATTKRFLNTESSARDILRDLPGTPVSLQMENELESKGNKVHKTGAFLHVNNSMSRWIHDVKDALFKKSSRVP